MGTFQPPVSVFVFYFSRIFVCISLIYASRHSQGKGRSEAKRSISKTLTSQKVSTTNRAGILTVSVRLSPIGDSRRRLGAFARARGKVLDREKKEDPLPSREWAKERNIGVSSPLLRRKKFEEQSFSKSEKEPLKENNVKNSRHIKENNLGSKENRNRDLEAKENKEIDENVKDNEMKEIEKPSSDHSKKSRPISSEEFTIDKLASDTLLKRLDEPDIAQPEEKKPEVYSEDEESTLSSPSATSSTSDMDNPPVSAKEDDSPKYNTTTTAVAPAHRIKEHDPGKKKTDFKSQLKRTGLSPRMDLTAATKKYEPEKIDLRKNLKSAEGGVPLTRRGSWSEKYGPSLKDRPSKVKKTEEEPANIGGTRRKISSTDLFNLIGKPVEPKPKEPIDSSKQARPKQPYKYEPPKIVEPEQSDFQNIMAKRKKSASRQFSPAEMKGKTNRTSPQWSPKQLRKATYVPSMPKGLRKLSVEDVVLDTKDGIDFVDEDIDDLLKDVDVKDLELQEELKPSPRATRKTSSGNIRW